jgi:hypothetical protein
MVHWKCECDYWNEATYLEPSDADSETCHSRMGSTLNLSTTKERFSVHNLDWHIYHYNFFRRFTYEEDAFDVFRGILNRMTAVSKVDFHWGLVGASFHQALLWRDECLLGYRKDLRRQGKTTLVSADGVSYGVPLPSWSWLGWYARLGVPSNTVGHVRNTVDINTRTTKLVAKWLRADINGYTASIKCHTPSALLQYGVLDGGPEWAGKALKPDFSSPDNDFRDSGHITA